VPLGSERVSPCAGAYEFQEPVLQVSMSRLQDCKNYAGMYFLRCELCVVDSFRVQGYLARWCEQVLPPSSQDPGQTPQVGGPREVGFSYERGTPVGEVDYFFFTTTPSESENDHNPPWCTWRRWISV